MTLYIVEPTNETLHGHFSHDLPPVLTIASGDTVQYRTLDAAWHVFDHPSPFEKPAKFVGRNRERDPGHALCGPIAIQEAKAGMTLEVRLQTIRPGSWGWSSGGGFASEWNNWLNLAEGPELIQRWALNPEEGIAKNQFGQFVRIRPFMGILGMPPAEPGRHSTIPPRFCGGNIDCKELIQGSRLFLPIAVNEGLFSLGDGHAVQGDGEVAGPALECPMERVEVEFHLHPKLHLAQPYAETPAGWITFGFHQNLNEASMMALAGMLDLMVEKFGLERKESLALASLVVELRISQVVNGVRGIHAILPHERIEGIKRKSGDQEVHSTPR